MPRTRETRQVVGEGGAILSTAEYVDGVLDGVTRQFSASGVMTLEAHCQNGEYHVAYRSWWDTGILKEEGAFAHGKRAGIYKWYHQDGTLWSQHDYDSTL